MLKTLALRKKITKGECVLERRGRCQNDLTDGDLYGKMITVFIVAVVLVLLLGFIVLSSRASSYKAALSHNETAEAINSHVLEERKAILEFVTYDYDAETYLVEMNDPGLTWRELLAENMSLITALFAVINSIGFFWAYVKEHDKSFFLADLPRTFFGFVLFCLMFVAWPIFAISWIRMRIYFSPLRTKEREEVKRVARQRLDEERRAQKEVVTQRNNYISYRVGMCKDLERRQKESAEKRFRAAERALTELDAKMRDLGQKIIQAQTELGESRVELRRVEGLDYSLTATRKRAEDEWDALLQMRGVVDVTVRDEHVLIFVKVEVPYNGALYDFGDYEISLKQFYWECKHKRSGRRLDATSSYPDYSTGDGFCFGNRRNTIDGYVSCGRYSEAVTLIIDSLHSVNNGQAAREIPYCFRKIRTIQEKKRRLERRGY